MKYMLKGISCLIIFQVMFLSAEAGVLVKKPRADSYGIYTLEYSSSGVGYIVDTITQLCFIYTDHSVTYDHSAYGSGGLVQVQCQALAKRPEWKAILSWVK